DAESAGGSVAAPTHAAAPSGTPSTAAQSAAPAAPAAPPELAPEPAPVSEPVPLPTVNGRRIRRRTFVAAGVVIVLAIGASLARRATGAAGAARPVVAVGRIRDVGVPDSAAIGGVLSEMLATSLSRVNDLQVIANSRMLELTPRGADTLRSALTDAARRAGATEMIEGELIPLADHHLRLDIRRVEIARGLVLGGYQLTGDNRIALFDSAAAMIAGDLRLDAPTRSLAEVSTRSPIAYRFYEDGLRAFYQFDALTADRLFRSAVREDSSFAMAAYYAWRSAVAAGDSDQITLADLALRLASRASERDALLIRTHVGVGRNDIAALAAAETLATRYPRDPEALTRAADAIPDLERATSLLNRSIALDSASGTRAGAICRL